MRLSLAPGFQQAADIVGTAISPDWDQIGTPAAVAAVRTFLNYVLQRELGSDDGHMSVAVPLIRETSAERHCGQES